MATRLSWGVGLAGALVRGDLDDSRIDQDMLAELSALLGFEEDGEALRFRDLAGEHGNTLLENLQHLLGTLERGGKKTLADTLGVDPTTISRWLNGASVPHKSTLHSMVGHFGLSPDTDLERDPVYLSSEPVALAERRTWLKSRIEDLSVREMRALYPGLRRMLEER